jgi:hypothetical protein
MSAPYDGSVDAIALQIAAALETYDRDAIAMVDAWPDLDRYRGVSEQIEGVRMLCSSLPQVGVQWVELLIAHAELVHFLWRLQYGDRPAVAADIGPVREHHADCVRALRRRCLRIAGAAHETQKSS